MLKRTSKIEEKLILLWIIFDRENALVVQGITLKNEDPKFQKSSYILVKKQFMKLSWLKMYNLDGQVLVDLLLQTLLG